MPYPTENNSAGGNPPKMGQDEEENDDGKEPVPGPSGLQQQNPASALEPEKEKPGPFDAAAVQGALTFALKPIPDSIVTPEVKAAISDAIQKALVEPSGTERQPLKTDGLKLPLYMKKKSDKERNKKVVKFMMPSSESLEEESESPPLHIAPEPTNEAEILLPRQQQVPLQLHEIPANMICLLPPSLQEQALASQQVLPPVRVVQPPRHGNVNAAALAAVQAAQRRANQVAPAALVQQVNQLPQYPHIGGNIPHNNHVFNNHGLQFPGRNVRFHGFGNVAYQGDELPLKDREVSEPVWTAPDPNDPTSKKNHNVYVMYHSTKTPEAVRDIMSNGFKPSTHGVLGAGIYVSRDYRKATQYGPFTFKLLVYPGNVALITNENSHLKENWQGRGYDSAWIPPDQDWARQGLEENCIRENGSIRIMGLCKGYNLLPEEVKHLVTDISRKQSPLNSQEEGILKKFLCDLGLTDEKLVQKIQELGTKIAILRLRIANSQLKQFVQEAANTSSQKQSKAHNFVVALRMLDLNADELKATLSKALSDATLRIVLLQGENAIKGVLEEDKKLLGDNAACGDFVSHPENEPVVGPSGINGQYGGIQPVAGPSGAQNSVRAGSSSPISFMSVRQISNETLKSQYFLNRSLSRPSDGLMAPFDYMDDGSQDEEDISGGSGGEEEEDYESNAKKSKMEEA